MAVSMEEVVRVLQSRIGARYEGIEGDGRDEMIRVLKKEFNLSGTEADDVIDGLVRSGTIRYHTNRDGGEGEGEGDTSGEDAAVLPPIIPAVGLGTGGSGGGIGLGAAAIPLAGAGGYWRIGNEDDLGV